MCRYDAYSKADVDAVAVAAAITLKTNKCNIVGFIYFDININSIVSHAHAHTNTHMEISGKRHF